MILKWTDTKPMVTKAEKNFIDIFNRLNEIELDLVSMKEFTHLTAGALAAQQKQLDDLSKIIFQILGIKAENIPKLDITINKPAKHEYSW